VLHHSFPSIFDPGFGSRTVYQIGPAVENPDPAERAAILEAIEKWEASMRKAPGSVDFPVRNASGAQAV
jgi:hypothetical protein